jgi:shikimate kinase
MSWGGYIPGDIAATADSDYWLASVRQAHNEQKREQDLDAFERIIELLESAEFDKVRGAWHTACLLRGLKVGYAQGGLPRYE